MDMSPSTVFGNLLLCPLTAARVVPKSRGQAAIAHFYWPLGPVELTRVAKLSFSFQSSAQSPVAAVEITKAVFGVCRHWGIHTGRKPDPLHPAERAARWLPANADDWKNPKERNPMRVREFVSVSFGLNDGASRNEIGVGTRFIR